MSAAPSRRLVRAWALAGALLTLALVAAPAAPACAGPLARCVPPPPGTHTTTAPAGRIGFGALGSVARLLPAESYGVDVRARPVTVFAQAGDRLRLVVVRWTAAGGVDRRFGDGESGDGVAQRFVAVTTEATGTPRIGATSDGGLVVGVPLSDGGLRRVALVRLDAAGGLAAGFGEGGVVVLDGMDLAAGPQELAGGALVVGGSTGPAGGRVAVLGADGRPETQFGDGGAVALTGRPTAVAQAGDGVVVGLASAGSQIRIQRLSRSGAAEEPAGPGGVQTAGLSDALGSAPAALHARTDGSVTVVGSVQRARPQPSLDQGPVSNLFVVRFPPAGDVTAPVAEPALGTATIDPAGRVLVAAPDGRRIRRYGLDGRLDRTFGRAGTVTARLPRGVTRRFATLAVLANGAVLAGGPGRWDGVAAPTFLRLRADGTRDAGFGTRLLTLRQTSAPLRAHDVIALRVHCDDEAQRRCVVRLRAGARTVRAFVAPGGDRRIPVRVGAADARRITARGRAIVRVGFSVVDEAVRVEALDAPVVVRRR
jgi:hypothetical protein